MPNTSDIWGQHRTLIGVVRIFAFLGFWAGMLPTSVTIALAIYEWNIAFYNVGPPFIFGMGLMLPAIAIWVLAPWIARKALPNPLRSLCPSCGYDLKDTTSDRCTECGLTLSEEFRAGAVLPGPSQTPPARAFMQQGQMAGIARLIGALLILPCSGLTLGMLIGAVDTTGRQPAMIFSTVSAFAGVGMVFCLVPWVLPRWTGRMLVPVDFAGLPTPSEGISEASSRGNSPHSPSQAPASEDVETK